MDVISFRCAACQQVLRVGADKAGRKAKCTKCGKELTIPQPSPAPEKTPVAPAGTPSATAPTAEAKKFSDDEDDDGAAYTFVPEPTPVEEKPKRRKKDDDDDDEEEEEEEPKKTAGQPRTRHKLKKRTVQFAEDWLKFRVTMVLVFIGMCGWLLMWILHTTVVLLGLFHAPAYGETVDRAAQGGGDVDKPALVVALLAGPDNAELGKTLLVVEQIVGLLSGVLFLAGYCMCLGVPNRFGTRGQAITLVVLSGINLLLTVMFRLLPLIGAMSYIMVPLVAPEIVLNEANIDRVVPVHAFWCGAPFWENFATIIIQVLYFLEPIFFAIFMRTASMCLKDDEWLEPKAFLLMRVGFGQLFILLALYVLSICGTSSMLRLVLFVNYFLWRGFLLGFLIWYAIIAIKGRARVEYLLVPDEDDEENDDEDEE